VDDQHRNDAIDRELHRAFAAAGGAAPGPHVDAELAAAWMERRLDGAAAQAVETHLADCGDCQALVATLTRISPELPAGAEGPGWWRRLRAGWLVPATVAAAAAFVIWVALPQQQAPSAPAESTQARAASSALESQPAPPEPVATAPPTPPARPRAEPPSESQRKAVAQPQVPPLVDQARAPAAADTLERPERLAEAAARSDSAKAEADAAKVEARGQRDNRITVTGETPAAPAAPPPAAQRQEAFAGRAGELKESISTLSGAAPATLRAAGGLLVVAGDGSARWRRMGAAIEFAPRADAAATRVTLPVAADVIVAGSAPAGTVCWLVGRGGTVLVTTDGVRFVRVATPAVSDLGAIVATDARTAIVTAADGRRFRTVDQGATWQSP